MTNPQHEALVEAVARAICSVNVQYAGISDDRTLEQRIFEEWEDWKPSAIAALSATAATPSGEVVRLRAEIAEMRAAFIRIAESNSPIEEKARQVRSLARAALEPQGKDL